MFGMRKLAGISRNCLPTINVEGLPMQQDRIRCNRSVISFMAMKRHYVPSTSNGEGLKLSLLGGFDH